ncbi:MAG TPA: carbon-nitrogen hydrolase [Bacteroidales bacterium]|nr:carbon-nitrogen hydrolase [Bacteroidales bacterium]
MKLGIVQRSCTDDALLNLEKTMKDIRTAASGGANIVCLQELFMTRYFCDTENYDNFNFAEHIPGPSTAKLQALAGELSVVIVASLFEKVDAGVYFNTAAVIDADGSYLGKYRKNHIPDDPGYFEKFYFSPGDTGYQVFNTRYGRIGVLVCWDQWYPEAARITSLMGAQILFYPTAIGWSPIQDEHTNADQYQAWQTIQRGHAIANGVYVMAVNRCGIEKDMKFWGGSFVANPFGKVLYQSPHDTEDIKVVEIDLSLSDFYRVHWPFIRDRRIETYKPLINRYLKT